MATKKIPIGVQLYSVREDCKKDLAGTLKAVAQMGYKAVEFAGYYDHSAADLRKLLDENKLTCCGTHTGLDTLSDEKLAATIEFNKTIGNKFLIVPWMDKAGREEWLKRAALYNEISDKVRPQGMYIGYHAHAHDFEPIGAERPWDLFFGNTKAEVVMQLDTGNCRDGGADPVEVLKKYPGRAITVHFKEHGGKGDAVIGEGDVNWKEVFATLETQGKTQWYIVEHERGAANSMADVQKCLESLKKMGKA